MSVYGPPATTKSPISSNTRQDTSEPQQSVAKFNVTGIPASVSSNDLDLLSLFKASSITPFGALVVTLNIWLPDVEVIVGKVITSVPPCNKFPVQLKVCIFAPSTS